MTARDDADERWREVFCELVKRARDDTEFRTRVEATGAVIANFDAVLTRHHNDHMPATGRIACGEYWWGFQLEIPHGVLLDWCAASIESRLIAAAIDTGIGPAAAFRRRLAGWIANRLPELKQLDQGAGIYASMTWIAPNVFIATPIRVD